MADAREPYRQWLRNIAKAKGTTLSQVAKNAKVVQSTITRFVNDPQYPYELSARTIRALEEFSGMEAPRTRTFSDNSNATFELDKRAQGALAPARETMMAPDDALNLHGIRRGDLCEIDTHAAPQVGDIVQVQIRAGFKTRDTTVRIYDPPYLMAHSTDYSLNRPLLIDPTRAKVTGVIVKVIRQLRDINK